MSIAAAFGFLPWLALGLYLLVVARWWWGHVELSRAAAARLLQPGGADQGDGALPTVTVIVPVHNEAAVLGACLERVLSQDYPDLQVIVANDRSTDATGRIAHEFADAHPNLTCVDIASRPEGWLGKTHALAVAARQARGELLVFTDGDVVWHPTLLRTLVPRVQHEQIDFLSLWPKVVLNSFWESALIPVCGWVLSLSFRNSTVPDDRKAPAFANGQFLLIRRRAYEQIGGHAAVRDEMAEDIALARLARQAGLRRYVGIGRDLLSTRMYENLGQVISGWTRIFIGALETRARLLASMLTAALGVWSAFIVLGVVAGRRLAGAPGSPLEAAWLAAAGAHLAGMYSLLYRQFRLGSQGRVYLWLFPLSLAGAVGLLAWCMLLASGVGTIRWGDVRYRVRGSRAVAGRAAGEPGAAASDPNASASIRSA